MNQNEIKYIKGVLNLHAKRCFDTVDMYTAEIKNNKGKDIADTYKQLRSRYKKEANKAHNMANNFSPL